MSKSRDAGTRWETQVVKYLQEQGWPHAERRALNGNKDKGDISGVIGTVIECKAAGRIALAEWVKEMETEQKNANAEIAALWLKRRGKTSAGDGYVVLTGSMFTKLLREAGW